MLFVPAKLNTFLARDGVRFYLDGIISKNTGEKYNLRSKWTSICTALDFAGDNWDIFVNGKEEDGKVTSNLRPVGGRLSDEKDLPMVVRVAHYYFDNKPIIGRIVDFHVWDR